MLLAMSAVLLGVAVIVVRAEVLAGSAAGSPTAPTAAPTTGPSVWEVPLIETPVEPGAIILGDGFLKARLKINDELWLRHFDIDKYVKMVEQPKYRDWFWLGEQPGKWLEAALLTSASTHDGQLREEARTVLQRLEAAQQADGYLGVTDTAYRTTTRPVRGMDAYEGYFTVHALITSWQQTNDPAALAAAKRFGDFWLANFGPGKNEFSGKPVQLNHTLLAGHSVHYGLEGTLLIDPMMRLYEVTGDTRYLKWCQWVVSNIDKWSGCDTFSNLDKVVSGQMTIDQVQPYVHAHTFHMNFEGFLRLYRATGDQSLLRKVVASWDDIASRQMYITGGVSVGEHYEHGHTLPDRGNVVETCASMSWIELSQMLLELSGNPKYADAIERLMFNHLAAAQSLESGIFRYHTPLLGERPLGYQHGPDCCTSSGPRIMGELPGLIYATGPDGIYINQYAQSTTTVNYFGGETVKLVQTTGYPASDDIYIHVSPAVPALFQVHLRIPGWCEGATLTVNGAAMPPPKSGTYAVIRRTWNDGDVVLLRLPLNVKWIKGDYGNQGLWCLTRGPIVYALDSLWFDGVPAPGPGAMFDPAQVGGIVFDHDQPPTPTQNIGDNLLGPQLVVPIRSATGHEGKAIMIPFGEIGSWERPGRSDPEGTQFPYAVWVVGDDSPAFVAATKIIDSVWVGVGSSEADHGLAGDSIQQPQRLGRMAREAKNWFSYQMAVPESGGAVLHCTYSGRANPAHHFSILVDGQKIATQTLGGLNVRMDLVDVDYPVPATAIRGKTKVEVKFQADSQSTAGGLICATMRREDIH
jgi:hypothetical protein